ncbi:MAG TPA: ankyrin repeat domain-containing protein, partial [Verrucomicrobiota bacterium]|nr:ankyrin repeat domain-containing protein [Verrucomicrobiota bacterium]
MKDGRSKQQTAQRITKTDRNNLIRACRVGDIKRVRSLLTLGIDINNVSEFCPLASAVRGGHLAMVKTLLKLGADPNLQETWVSMPPNGTPLENAARNGEVEIAKVLIAHGADVNKVGYWHPLLTAVSHHNNAIVRLLLDSGGKLQGPELMQAVFRGNVEAARMLIEHGIDINWQSKEGETALHVGVIKSGWWKKVESLKERL